MSKVKTKSTISKLTCNGIDITDPREICSNLNNYFCSIGTSLANSLNTSGQSDFRKYCLETVKDSMFCSPVLPDEI